MAERLAVDVSQTYTTGWIGKRGNDKYPCTGTRIVRVEFHKEVDTVKVGPLDIPGMGRGDAYTTDTELPDIVVHYWLDMGTRLKYVLRVWVED